MKELRVLLVSEFPVKSGAPTGALASDLEAYLASQKHTAVRFLTISRPYVPGGLSPSRIWNLVFLHVSMCFVLPVERVLSVLKGHQLCVVATTSPPFIHWTSSILARIFRVPTIIWFQDAHPEIEARALEKKRYFRTAKALRLLNRYFTTSTASFVALDEAMRSDFVNRTGYRNRSEVVPPWSTYLSPARPIRLPPKNGSYKILYAGNYGKVHDLTPLAKALSRKSQDEQSRISMTFVGMNVASQEKLKDLFSELIVNLNFMPRLALKEDLIELFKMFDFGIVSLAENSKGVACPSKALTYLSQGLPILYIGPNHTLPWQLIREGWGIFTEDLLDLKNEWSSGLQARDGTIFPNPKPWAQTQLFEIIKTASART